MDWLQNSGPRVILMLEQLVARCGSSRLHTTDDFQFTVFFVAATCRYQSLQVDTS